MIKNEDRKPVIIKSRKIINSWWSKAWIDNLNKYADFSNRLPRGRSYVRKGAVIHLEITNGEIFALVQGNSDDPYEVYIGIEKLSDKNIASIKNLFQENICSIDELIKGEFPLELSNALTQKKYGFFPKKKDLHLYCSCPDWAVMCKHVIAVLYAFGVKLDKEPLLFLELRGLNSKQLIKEGIKEKLTDMLKEPSIKSNRIIESNKIDDLFGI